MFYVLMTIWVKGVDQWEHGFEGFHCKYFEHWIWLIDKKLSEYISDNSLWSWLFIWSEVRNNNVVVSSLGADTSLRGEYLEKFNYDVWWIDYFLM